MSMVEVAITLALVAIAFSICAAVFAIVAIRRTAPVDQIEARRQAALAVMRIRDEWQKKYLEAERFAPKI